MKKHNLKRDISLTFRVNQEEWSLIYKRMTEAGMKSRNFDRLLFRSKPYSNIALRWLLFVSVIVELISLSVLSYT